MNVHIAERHYMLYTYRCSTCGEEIEKDCKMGTQPDHVECEACGGTAHRVFEAPNVVYKGTGWAGHGVPDMDEREEMPGPLDFDDLLPEE